MILAKVPERLPVWITEGNPETKNNSRIQTKSKLFGVASRNGKQKEI